MYRSLSSVGRRLALLSLAAPLFVGCTDAPTSPDIDEAPALTSLAKTGAATTARSILHTINDSGITAKLHFTDDGSTLWINGTATGLTPGIPYASLIYDNQSVAVGPEACEPAIFDPEDPDYILETMFVGLWNVRQNGTGTLSATNTNFGADYVPLNKFRTISVRDLTINEGFGPEAVVACGEVRR